MFEPEIIKYAIENLIERKSRSFLTILSIMIGIAAIFIFASFGVGLYNYVNDIAQSSGIDKFMVQGAGMGAPGIDNTFKLEDKDFKAIERTKGIKQVSAWYMKPAEVIQKDIRKYVFVAGIRSDPADIKMLEDMMGVEIAQGRQLKDGDSGRVVLGNSYSEADALFPLAYKVGDKIEINQKKFDIIGFYGSVGNPQDDSNIYLLENDMKKLYGDDITYGVLIGSVTNVDKIDETIEAVKKNLRKVRNVEEGKEDFFIQTFADAIEMFSNVINIVVGFILLIVLISGFVASINTANTMVTSVLERVQEIGVMKAIGATNDKIKNIFLLESSILGLVAGIFGVLVGWGLSSFGGNILSNLGWDFLAPDFPIWLFAFCILLSSVVGAASGMFPALYASKQNVVDALRYE